jgi:hypothetical protein
VLRRASAQTREHAAAHPRGLHSMANGKWKLYWERPNLLRCVYLRRLYLGLLCHVEGIIHPTSERALSDPELPVVNGSFKQSGAHGWQEPDGVRMRARRTARSA